MRAEKSYADFYLALILLWNFPGHVMCDEGYSPLCAGWRPERSLCFISAQKALCARPKAIDSAQTYRLQSFASLNSDPRLPLRYDMKVKCHSPTCFICDFCIASQGKIFDSGTDVDSVFDKIFLHYFSAHEGKNILLVLSFTCILVIQDYPLTLVCGR